MIMVPLLILQILLFPVTAAWLMNIWVNSRQSLALQDATSHIASVIQQLYSALNHNRTILAGKTTYSPGLPPLIEGNVYAGNATLKAISLSGNAAKILNLSFKLLKTSITATSSVVLGPNALWKPSTFMSNSTYACITANKTAPNGSIVLWFGN